MTAPRSTEGQPPRDGKTTGVQMRVRFWRYEQFNPQILQAHPIDPSKAPKTIGLLGSARANRAALVVPPSCLAVPAGQSTAPWSATQACASPHARRSWRCHSEHKDTGPASERSKQKSTNALMKGKCMSSARSKSTLPLGNKTQPRPEASGAIRIAVLLLAISTILVLANGCASVSSQTDSDPWQYNPNTGYPAVGGPSWGRF